LGLHRSRQQRRTQQPDLNQVSFRFQRISFLFLGKRPEKLPPDENTKVSLALEPPCFTGDVALCTLADWLTGMFGIRRNHNTNITPTLRFCKKSALVKLPTRPLAPSLWPCTKKHSVPPTNQWLRGCGARNLTFNRRVFHDVTAYRVRGFSPLTGDLIGHFHCDLHNAMNLARQRQVCQIQRE
jgi:hypothetical protein